MRVRVELTSDASIDLPGYAESGNLNRFLKKLIWLEEAGKNAGTPLRGTLAGWRKIVVGDRDWRIIFRMNADDAVATVWVIGDRADAECYEIAQRRVEALGSKQPEAVSLAAAMYHLAEARRKGRPRKQ